MRLKSRWPAMKTAASAMERSPSARSASEAKGASPAARITWKTRTTERKAKLVIPPAISAPSRPGASP